ncbi:MAG: type II toxin-antitoxin system RelE/ParE family toxin [Anaerolineae bacterium]|nr:type II toxin-antitoxin system RelE/ParE family toxin [Anaerolineae bacterium]
MLRIRFSPIRIFLCLGFNLWVHYGRITEKLVTLLTLPAAETLNDISQVKAMKGFPNRYRVRIGDYRVGLELFENEVEIIRVLHRREFYRYFP